MRLHDFAVLTDANIHPEVVAYLRARGCSVLDVCESGLAAEDDLALIQLARSQDRVIVTHDSDFGALSIARLEPIVGILFLRPEHINPQFTIESLQVLFGRELDVTPPFIVVAKRTAHTVAIRVRIL